MYMGYVWIWDVDVCVLRTHSNFEINHLLGERRHVVCKTEFIFSNVVCSKDKVSLTFLYTFQYRDIVRSGDSIVNIESTS